jgi:preprotein translocase subunit SecE
VQICVGQRGDGGAEQRVSAVTQTRSEATRPSGRAASTRRGGLLVDAVLRVVRFVREVVAELIKVIWPTRNELVTYTIVVIIFMVIMIAFVAGLDLGFAKLIVAVFS